MRTARWEVGISASALVDAMRELLSKKDFEAVLDKVEADAIKKNIAVNERNRRLHL